MMSKFIFLILVGFFVSSISHAEDPEGKYLGSKCVQALGCLGGCGEHPRIVQISSGEDHDTFEQSKADAQIIYGISKKLNYDIPNNIIRHSTHLEMSAVASAGGHPAPVWTAGAKLASGIASTLGVYEVVFPGRNVHDQYIRTGNSIHDNRTVFSHVGGHYHFAVRSPYARMRDLDQIGDTQKLADFMSGIKNKVNESEYSDWFHRLETLEYLQDLARGAYYPPSYFEHKTKNEFSETSTEDRPHPAVPTYSVLQALVANLPPSTPAWKVEMARLYEKSVKILGFYTQDKVMNEGFAVLSQYQHLRHGPAEWKTEADAMEYAKINAGVVFPELSNPYWLGVEAWKIRYNKFKVKMAPMHLSELELDARFTTEVVNPIIEGGYNDFTFIRDTLDSDWVAKHQLYLTKTEIEGQEQVTKIESRDPKRIIDSLSQQHNKDIVFARIRLVNLNDEKSGKILLKHDPAYGIPLKLYSLSPALYQVARVMKAPVKLETIWSAHWFSRASLENLNPQEIGNMVVEVNAAGEVKLTIASEKIPDELKASLAKALQGLVDGFKDDLTLSYGKEILRPELQAMSTASTYEPTVTGLDSSILGHMPTTTEAILELLKMKKKMFAVKALAAVRGEAKASITQKGVRVKILPDTPVIENDTSIIGSRVQFRRKNPGPLSFKTDFGGRLAQLIPDEDLGRGSGDGLPGDVIDRKPAGGGAGAGEGEEGESTGKKPGSGKGDPKVEEIPREVYGKMLAEDIEIRNLRKTTMQDEEKNALVRAGEIKRASSDVLWQKTAGDAYQMGLIMQRLENSKLPPDKQKKRTNAELIRYGFRFLPESEYTSPSLDVEPEPTYSVVLMVLADVSGSMTNEHKAVMRRAIYNQVAVLSAVHKKVIVRYFHYSSGAKEVSEKDFYTKSEGSSTDTISGLNLVAKVLESEYPHEKINRVVSLYTDGDDFVPEQSAKVGADLARKVDYFTYANIDPKGERVGPLSEAFEELSKNNPDHVGYANISADPRTIYQAIKIWFGKR